MKKVELLAPAGSFEKAKIAFLYGADAVYCGTSSLSLRTRADMQDNDLEETIKYAHEIGKKVYVTLNIFAWDEKYNEIIEMAKKLEKLKPDGIIAADGGVIDVLKEYAPSVPINVSTQANLVSLHSCNFWYKNGAKRMIMAREMNKEQLKYIMENKPKKMNIRGWLFIFLFVFTILVAGVTVSYAYYTLNIRGQASTEENTSGVLNVTTSLTDSAAINTSNHTEDWKFKNLIKLLKKH